MPKIPRHGTEQRYRIELKAGNTCDRCKAAHRKVRQRERDRARDRGMRAVITLVPRPQSIPTDEPQEPAGPAQAGYRQVPAYGTTEKAVRDDLEQLADKSLPFFESYKAAAIVLAREIDSVDSKTSKAPLVKQLVDTIRELKGKEGAGADAFASLLEQLAQPLVPA